MNIAERRIKALDTIMFRAHNILLPKKDNTTISDKAPDVGGESSTRDGGAADLHGGDDARKVGALLHSEFLAGRAFHSLLDRDFHRGIVDVAGDFGGQVPLTDFLAEGDPVLDEALLGRLTFPSRGRLKSALKKVPLGLFVINGFAGSGKTEILAVVALLCLSRSNKVMCCAKTNFATTHLAKRIRRVAEEVNGGLRGEGDNGDRLYLPFVVRGTSLKLEKAALIKTVNRVFHPDPTANLEEFIMPLSVCDWLLRVIQFGAFDLHPDDNPKLFQLRHRFQQKVRVEPLRSLFNLQASSEDAGVEHDDSKEDYGHDSRLNNLLNEMMREIVFMADCLCTTTYASRDEASRYWHFNKAADITILHEAAALTVGEAMMAWPTLRPCIMAGDEMLLSPKMRAQFMGRQKGGVTNKFAMFGLCSIFEKTKRIGWPIFALHQQLRMVSGAFDLVQEVFYPHIGDNLQYSVAVKDNPVGQRMEAWVAKNFPDVRINDEKIRHLFVNCLNTTCRVEDSASRSRYNKKQAAITTDLVGKLVNDKELDAGDTIVVICPYAAMKRVLMLYWKAAGLSVPIMTADAVQGGAAQIVVTVLTNTLEKGPGFLAHSHRVCVALSRHRAFNIVIGDIELLRTNTPGRLADTRRLGDMHPQSLHPGAMRHWFEENGRVATVTVPEMPFQVRLPRSMYDSDVGKEEKNARAAHSAQQGKLERPKQGQRERYVPRPVQTWGEQPQQEQELPGLDEDDDSIKKPIVRLPPPKQENLNPVRVLERPGDSGDPAAGDQQ